MDGTKIKAKTSMHKLTNDQQLKIMKQHLEESIKSDEEDLKLGEKSNSVPETLTDKKIQETYEKINESSKDDEKKDKLRSSSKKLLKQLEYKPEKILKKIETLEEKLKESGKDVISLNESLDESKEIFIEIDLKHKYLNNYGLKVKHHNFMKK